MLTAEISRTRCRGIETNAIHFCTLISASDAQGDWQLAVDLFPGGNELSTGFAQLDFTHLISLASNVMNGALASQSWLESPSEFEDTSSGIQKASPDVFGMAALFSCDFALPILGVIDVSNKTTLPIGSMYAIYGNIYHQYTPVMLAYIYQHHGSYGLYPTKNPDRSHQNSYDWMMVFADYPLEAGAYA